MNIEKELFDAAANLIKVRYPKGDGYAAAMLTEDGQILTSVAPHTFNPSTEICVETGAICEAHKLNKKITHSICVFREDENSHFQIFSPCGICQERLFYWGKDVKAAISSKTGDVIFKTLSELQPYHWYNIIDDTYKF
ncbi:cytidine deaminase [Neobacillus sp. D3-1R]|uniref:cytidine deaminase n=1 Tax=Neobacillus sp. D3-1R TaxID=3445778 RepID=UPI003FA09795